MSILAGETDAAMKRRAKQGDAEAKAELIARGLANDPDMVKMARKSLKRLQSWNQW